MTVPALQVRLLAVCIVAGLAHVVAWTDAGRQHLWSVHHAAFLPTWVATVLTAGLGLSLVPAVARRLAGALLAGASVLRHAHRWLPLATACGAALLLFLSLPVEHGLLGDADTRLAEVGAHDIAAAWQRPHDNDTAVRNLLHQRVGRPLGASAADTYGVISALWGVVLLAVGWRLSARLAGPGAGRLLLFAPLATSGYMLLFCRYIEAYSSVAALGVALVAVTARYARGRCGFWLPVSVWLLLTAHHLLGAVAGAALALGVIRRHQLDTHGLLSWLPTRVTVRLPGVVGFAAGLAAWGVFLLIRPTSAVPLLWAYEHIPYRLFDGAHLIDVGNFLLLAGLPAVVAAAAAWRAPRAASANVEHELLLAAACSTAVLMFVVNPALGRLDWDLMAMHAPLWVLAGSAALWRRLQHDAETLRYAAGALLAVSLFHTIPWIALQQIPGRAAQAVEAMVEGDPHVAGQRTLKLGARLEQLGLHEAAQRQYARAVEQNPGSALAHFNLARMRYDAGDLAGAVRLYETATRLNADLSNAWNNLGGAYLRLQRPADAVRVLEPVVDQHPNFAGAWSNLATAYYELERYEQAAPAFARAVELDGRLHTALYNLGVCYALLSQYGPAAATLERFVAREPRSAVGYLQLGDAYARLGRRADARRALQAFLQLARSDDPARARVLRYLRQIEADAAGPTP